MASSDSLHPDDSARANFPRRRTAYACQSCRSRKTRCDGNSPCSTCSTLAIDCIYGTESASSKGKSDLILDAIHRVENSVRQLENRITAWQSNPVPHGTGLQIEFDSLTARASSPISIPVSRGKSSESNLVDNAIISASHNSTTESILAWSIFDDIAPLRQDGHESIFQLENRRPIPRLRTQSPPYLSRGDADVALRAFLRSINFFYPVVTYPTLENVLAIVIDGQFEESLESCLALVVMALGCAVEAIDRDVDTPNQHDADHQQKFLSLSHAFFQASFRMSYLSYSAISPVAAQCLLLTALYYAFLQRPLQAWSMLSAVASKCQVLLAYGNLDSEGNECIRRMFWSCFILESDYLAELSILPHFGIGESESSIPLPGKFESHQDGHTQSQSSLYFLACISMRRLLNRVHHLLFDGEVGANLHDARFTRMVAELDQQLTRWKELLPAEFQFSVDQTSMPSQHAAFLRQRYLTCKALIYRPYLLKALSHPAAVANDTIQSGCKVCLQACLLHCLNLDHFTHTIMIDVWICALSMSGTMLMFLAVQRIPGLQDCFEQDIQRVGSHLRDLLCLWMSSTGSDYSPSVARAIDWIKIVDGWLQ